MGFASIKLKCYQKDRKKQVDNNRQKEIQMKKRIDTRISLHPMSLKEAVSAMLKVKPPKRWRKPRKARSKK